MPKKVEKKESTFTGLRFMKSVAKSDFVSFDKTLRKSIQREYDRSVSAERKRVRDSFN